MTCLTSRLHLYRSESANASPVFEFLSIVLELTELVLGEDVATSFRHVLDLVERGEERTLLLL